MVNIRDPRRLSDLELSSLKQNIARANMSLYQLEQPSQMDKAALKALCSQLGLNRLDSNLCSDSDGISSITVKENRQAGEYIPYTPSAISWHSDGYYNESSYQIRGMVLHCVHAAEAGGDNGFVDPEIVYIAMRDSDPEYVRALMQQDAMTIPPNTLGGEQIRPAVTGPVFSVDEKGRLHMRYTARTRSIEWKANAQAAAAFIQDYLNSQKQQHYYHHLSAGQGVISNNVLHCRERFEQSDQSPRLLYRARYYDVVES